MSVNEKESINWCVQKQKTLELLYTAFKQILFYKDAALPVVSNAKPCALISVQSQNSGAAAHKNGIFKTEVFSAPEKKFVPKSMPASSLYYIISETPIKWRDFITVAILFFINLLNYMDRFTIAGKIVKIAVSRYNLLYL
ncbi:protein spinster [Trichinella spiralis]|uniref:protein spinster n=1 Tax=Trichinella spiralis TaxID=6334 RepID=UPI0001EFD830|nr:protein spinster [Trichinella spiralis]